MEAAQKVLNDKSKVRSNSKKSIVLFTDGEPEGNRNSDTIRQDAITRAKNLKDGGVEIYTVGLFDSDAGRNARNLVEYISSDYPYAVSMSNPGNKIADPSFSYSQTSGETLVYDFGSIANTIISRSKTKVDNNVYLKDIVTEYFTVNEVTVYEKENNTLKTVTNINVKKTVNGKETTVKVGGFDISQYNLSNNKKLVVKIFTKAKDGYVFTNTDVYSNDEGSGLYKSDTDTSIEPFENPKVDLYGFEVNYLLSGTDTPVADNYSGYLFKGKDLVVSATDVDGYVKEEPVTDTVTETKNIVNFYYTPELSDTNITYTSTDYGKVKKAGTDNSPTDYIVEGGKIGSATIGATAVPDEGCRFVGWYDEDDKFITSTDTYNPGVFVNEVTYIAKFEPDTYDVVIRNSVLGHEKDTVTKFEVVIEASDTDYVTFTSLSTDTNVTKESEDGKITYTFYLHTVADGKTSAVITVPKGAVVNASETVHDGYYVSYNINETSEVEGDKAAPLTIEMDSQIKFINNAEYYELPHTGGNGTLFYTASGIIIVMLSAVLLICRKKQMD